MRGRFGRSGTGAPSTVMCSPYDRPVILEPAPLTQPWSGGRYGAAVDLGLRDRVAIVTGASRGIGRQVAVDLAAEGCNVLLCGRDKAALADASDAVRAAGAGAAILAV